MSGETWTEYAVRTSAGKFIHFNDRPSAEVAFDSLRSVGASAECTVVGRTVTASPWLPVDTAPSSERTEK